LFEQLSAALRPDAILATNTSSISITKMAAAAIPKGETAGSEKGKASAARVVGEITILEDRRLLTLQLYRAPFLQSGTGYGMPMTKEEILGLITLLQKLVELIPGLQTSDDTLQRARAFAVACGKGWCKDHPFHSA
jgi:3-hydroxybutyryl-CoA dehydrogenase